MEKIEGEPCPICHKKTLTLMEDEIDIPFFGKTYVFGMSCKSCGFNKSDVEAVEQKEPAKITFTVEKDQDMKVRVVKSSEASVNIPQMRMSMDPGANSIGFVTNIEGLLGRFKKIIEDQRDTTDDSAVKKAAKNLLKKLWKVECGDMPLKIIIKDPSGNSAIVSEKTVIEKLKK
ncbi:MAG: ZPR1 zinc finger domain-containing protein [Candidatus Woesearchaeota archaeon]